MFHNDGLNAFNDNNYEIAKDLFFQATSEYPQEAENYLYLGRCYFFCNETQLAISSLKQFIELTKNMSNEIANVSYAFDLLGQCYEAENNNVEALICYEKATNIYPLDASAWNNLGLIYIKIARTYLDEDLQLSIVYFNDALIYIKKALNLYKNNPLFLQSVASWFEQYIEVFKRITVEDECTLQKNIDCYVTYALKFRQKALLAYQG